MLRPAMGVMRHEVITLMATFTVTAPSWNRYSGQMSSVLPARSKRQGACEYPEAGAGSGRRGSGMVGMRLSRQAPSFSFLLRRVDVVPELIDHRFVFPPPSKKPTA